MNIRNVFTLQDVIKEFQRTIDNTKVEAILDIEISTSKEHWKVSTMLPDGSVITIEKNHEHFLDENIQKKYPKPTPDPSNGQPIRWR